MRTRDFFLPIVDYSSQLNLRAIMAEVESSLSSSSTRGGGGRPSGGKRRRGSDPHPKKNRGVKKRAEGDDRKRSAGRRTWGAVRAKLEEKAEIYDEMRWRQREEEHGAEREERRGRDGAESIGGEEESGTTSVAVTDEFGRAVSVLTNSSRHYAFFAREAHADRLRRM
mmetsp:Transcript_28911/g.57582  ORF Transcript_28911/g.57582 Transcript_28911/m.57582 type:complete len:168 (-) Transcript_28911:310-813(-)